MRGPCCLALIELIVRYNWHARLPGLAGLLSQEPPRCKHIPNAKRFHGDISSKILSLQVMKMENVKITNNTNDMMWMMMRTQYGKGQHIERDGKITTWGWMMLSFK